VGRAIHFPKRVLGRLGAIVAMKDGRFSV